MKLNPKNQEPTTILATQKGISILFAVAILSIILAIALGTSVVVIRQVKTMREIGHSVIALYAADSGMEEILMYSSPTDISGTVGEATYEVFVTASTTPECAAKNAKNYCIKSIGTYKDTKRAIEVKY